MEPKPNQPKINHYKYMKQKVKSTKVKDKNEKFHNCIAEWDEEEEIEEKMTTPISVLEHYKKYTNHDIYNAVPLSKLARISVVYLS